MIEQLQGFELAAGAWEESVLPARVAGYRPEWLDELCLSGEVVWGRLGCAQPASADEPALERRPRRRGALARDADLARAARRSAGAARARRAAMRAAGAPG